MIPQSPENELLIESAKQSRITSKIISALYDHIRALPKRAIHANYPITSTKSLPEGTTAFNFRTGEVILPDTSVEHISMPIDPSCHSLTIYTTREVKLELFENDRPESNIAVFPLWWKQNHINFNELVLTTSDTTSFYIIVSTNTEGTPSPAISILQPILKGSKFNESVTADTDIFTTAISPTYPTSTYSSYFRIYATFDTAGVLTVRRTYSGTTISENIYQGTPLTANSAYVFDVKVLKDQTINLRYSTTATALSLILSEIEGGI